MRKTYLIAFMVLSGWAIVHRCAFAKSTTSQTIAQSVKNFGAVGDGVADDRPKIQAAIDSLAGAGGGTIEFPAGIYRCCGVLLKSHITLQLDRGAVLQGPSKIEDYPKHAGAKGNGWSGDAYGVLGAENATDIGIIGEGRIDSAGQDSWVLARDKKAEMRAAGFQFKAGATAVDRPRMIQFNHCQRIRVDGITLTNSQMWTLVFNNCRDISVDGLTILNAPDSPETDGIDIRGCHHSRITRCHIDNGDDNVAITGVRFQPNDGEVSCEDVEVSDCVFLHGHGVSIGSPTMNGVRDVRVHDCTFNGTTNGIRIKSMRDRGGTVENVHYDRLKMTDVNPAITVNAYYVHPPTTESAEPVGKLTPIFRDIHISDLTATCPKSAGMIVGLPESLVSNFTMENVKITAATGLIVRDVKGMTMKNVEFSIESGPKLIESNADVQ